MHRSRLSAPQGLKPASLLALGGTPEAVSYPFLMHHVLHWRWSGGLGSIKSMDSREPNQDERAVEAHTFPSSIFGSPQKRRLIGCLLLVLATLALYSPVTRAPFLNYDDGVHVTENLHVRSGLTWNTVVWAFETSDASDWHPITWLSHALDCQLFGLNPVGHHTINVLLHAANAVLLFLILESATGLAWRSLVVAALFALHPINVESVAWISERKNVLSMFFFLVALAAYGWYARRPGVGRYLAVTMAYAFGLMTKAQVITFPFALLLLDYWPLCRLARADGVGNETALAVRGSSFWKLVWEKVPWFALSAIERGHHHQGGGERNPGETSALDTFRKCCDLLFQVSGKSFLAGQSGAGVSASGVSYQHPRGRAFRMCNSCASRFWR